MHVRTHKRFACLKIEAKEQET